MDDTQMTHMQHMLLWAIGAVVVLGVIAMGVFYFVLPPTTTTPVIAPEPVASTTQVTREKALNNYIQVTATTSGAVTAQTQAEQYAQDQTRAKALDAAMQKSKSSSPAADTSTTDRQNALDAYLKAQ